MTASFFHSLVVLDTAGFSKGYGFIRFGCEKEQQTALASMMGASGLGMKPIRVSFEIYTIFDLRISPRMQCVHICTIPHHFSFLKILVNENSLQISKFTKYIEVSGAYFINFCIGVRMF